MTPGKTSFRFFRGIILLSRSHTIIDENKMHLEKVRITICRDPEEEETEAEALAADSEEEALEVAPEEDLEDRHAAAFTAAHSLAADFLAPEDITMEAVGAWAAF